MWLLCNRFSMQVGMRIDATTTSSVLALLVSSGIYICFKCRRNCELFRYLPTTDMLCLHGGRLGTFNHVTDVNASGRQGGPDWETKCFIYMFFFFNPEKCKICWVFQLAFSLFPPTIVLSVTLTRANHTIISLTQWLSQLEHGRPFARLRVRVPFFLNDFDQVK